MINANSAEDNHSSRDNDSNQNEPIISKQHNRAHQTVLIFNGIYSMSIKWPLHLWQITGPPPETTNVWSYVKPYLCLIQNILKIITVWLLSTETFNWFCYIYTSENRYLCTGQTQSVFLELNQVWFVQTRNRWSFGMDKLIHGTHFWACN